MSLREYKVWEELDGDPIVFTGFNQVLKPMPDKIALVLIEDSYEVFAVDDSRNFEIYVKWMVLHGMWPVPVEHQIFFTGLES